MIVDYFNHLRSSKMYLNLLSGLIYRLSIGPLFCKTKKKILCLNWISLALNCQKVHVNDKNNTRYMHHCFYI